MIYSIFLLKYVYMLLTCLQAEGPKKIEDIHRDAAMERSRSQMLDRQQSGRGRDVLRGGPS